MSTGAAGLNDLLPPIATNEIVTNAVDASIVVEARLPHVYRQWLRVEDYPKFMHAIKTVRRIDPSHFAVEGELEGEKFSAVLEIMLRVPERRVAWRLLHDHLTAGVVSFVAVADGRTRVSLKMMSSFGGLLSERVESYLRQFKNLIEARINRDARGRDAAAHV
jgi:uncharacterized membrane protein